MENQVKKSANGTTVNWLTSSGNESSDLKKLLTVTSVLTI